MRPTLLRHRKFARLARLLGSRVVAVGHLELLWAVAYESGDELLGDGGDVEQLAEWNGEPGKLTDALHESGFIDKIKGQYRVHDLWDHAPDYVRKRRSRENERRSKGDTLRRAVDGDRSLTGQRPPNGRPRAPAPAPAPAQEAEACAEPEEAPASAPAATAPEAPPVASLPCVGAGPSTYPVTQAQVAGWQTAYPGVSVEAEVRKAVAWLEANPARRKTARGCPRFLVSWLSRAQDGPRNGTSKGPAPPQRWAPIMATGDHSDPEANKF